VTKLGSGALVYDRGRKAERMRPISDKVCEKGVWTNRESSSGYRGGGDWGRSEVREETALFRTHRKALCPVSIPSGDE